MKHRLDLDTEISNAINSEMGLTIPPGELTLTPLSLTDRVLLRVTGKGEGYFGSTINSYGKRDFGKYFLGIPIILPRTLFPESFTYQDVIDAVNTRWPIVIDNSDISQTIRETLVDLQGSSRVELDIPAQEGSLSWYGNLRVSIFTEEVVPDNGISSEEGEALVTEDSELVVME